MDLVVRTPHGDADLTVVSWSRDTTVADLVEAATGQVAPPLVHIDDRPVDASTNLRDARILIGSVVSSYPGRDVVANGTTVHVQQLTGPGAGTSRALGEGRYRIGPGRRLAAEELADAPVEQPILELRIERSAVELAPVHAADVAIDGRPLTAGVPWRAEHVRAGARVFTIDTSKVPARGRPVADVEPDGSLQFSRSPQLGADEPHVLVVDAVRRAERRDGALWRHRPGTSRALVLPFGLLDEQLVEQPMRQISITLEPGRPAAAIGSERFRESLARTLLVEATARYGPTDLGIVIATRSDRLARWDWAKWLPHLRHGDDIALLSVEAEYAAWTDATAMVSPQSSNGSGHPDRTTLLVIDDAELWSRSDSPWRQLIAAPPPHVVILALADRVAGAPAATRTIVVQESDQRCTLTAVGRSQPLPGILPALVEPDLAARFARALAPLRDAESPPPSQRAEADASSLNLTEALGTIGAGSASSGRPGSTIIALGATAAGSVVHRDFPGGTACAIDGIDGNDVAGTTIGVLLAIVASQMPEVQPIVLIAPAGRSPLAGALSRLAHFAGACNLDDPDECHRTLARLRHHLADGAGATIVLEGAQHHPELLSSLSQLTAGCAEARLVTTATVRPDAGRLAPWNAAPEPRLAITIDRRGGRRRGLVTTRNADGTDFDEPFEPFELSTAGPEDVLVVRPFVYGRALTTLERRLERSGSLESSPFGPEIDELVDRIAGGAGSDGIRSIPRSLVPDPLPDIVDMARLLATNEADAVPIGLADDPERGHHDIVWWQPGMRGSMLFVGGPRSGMDAAIGSLPVGIAERYAPSDVHLHSIDSSNRRLLPVQQLAHTRAAVSPDRLDHAAAIIDLIALEVAARRAPDVQNDPDGAVRPSLLLLIGDLTQLGRRLRDRTYDNTLDNLRLIAAAGDVGVNVVATVARASDSCGLIDLVDSLFVASPGAAVRGDALQLPVVAPGRCDWSATGQRVQLATVARLGESSRSDEAS